MNLEAVESLDINNNLENYNEGNAKITYEKRHFKCLDAPMMCHCDEVNELYEEGSTAVFDECCEVLEKIG